MRAALEEYITQAVVFRYRLPNEELAIDKSCYSTLRDFCYAASDDALKVMIYESIIDYAFNDSEWGETTVDQMLAEALDIRLRCSVNGDELTQLSYGFYGEVLLNILLQRIWGTKVIISKGLYTNYGSRREEFKGYDSFHLLAHDDGKVSLWFGEVKFHENYASALSSVFENIEKALSNDYFRSNLKMILGKKPAINFTNEKFNAILRDLRADAEMSIAGLNEKYGVRLVYPIFILTQEVNDYNDTIRKIINLVNTHHAGHEFTIDIPYDLFFILLPVKDVRDIKTAVLEWIRNKRPITL